MIIFGEFANVFAPSTALLCGSFADIVCAQRCTVMRSIATGVRELR